MDFLPVRFLEARFRVFVLPRMDSRVLYVERVPDRFADFLLFFLPVDFLPVDFLVKDPPSTAFP
jgi:hypothetical protein